MSSTSTCIHSATVSDDAAVRSGTQSTPQRCLAHHHLCGKVKLRNLIQWVGYLLELYLFVMEVILWVDSDIALISV